MNKINKDVLQPLADRIRVARNFLELFKPGIEYYIVPITDVAGPTGWDPNVQAIVVSKETLNGATASTSYSPHAPVYLRVPNGLTLTTHSFSCYAFTLDHCSQEDTGGEGLQPANNIRDRRDFAHGRECRCT